MNNDLIEPIRRAMVEEINSNPGAREALEAAYGQVWDTTELTEAFKVEGFLAPFVSVTRKSDGAQGALVFQHSPRFYYGFTEG